jgi:hypothetical protein
MLLTSKVQVAGASGACFDGFGSRVERLRSSTPDEPASGLAQPLIDMVRDRRGHAYELRATRHAPRKRGRPHADAREHGASGLLLERRERRECAAR